MNIATFGAAVKFDRANFIGVKGEHPVYRSGGIASLIKGSTGISWGRTSWANKKLYGDNIDKVFAHEGFHYEQQKKLGFANFYGRTIKEYAYYLTTGSRDGAYYKKKAMRQPFVLKQGETFRYNFDVYPLLDTLDRYLIPNQIHILPGNFITYKGIPLITDTIKIEVR